MDKPKAICSPLFQSWGHNYHQIRSFTHLITSSDNLLMTYGQAVFFHFLFTVLSIRILP